MWIAGGNGDSIMAYSTNGTTWANINVNGIFQSMCSSLGWNGSMWLASGGTTYRNAYSTNVTTWTGRNISPTLLTYSSDFTVTI